MSKYIKSGKWATHVVFLTTVSSEATCDTFSCSCWILIIHKRGYKERESEERVYGVYRIRRESEWAKGYSMQAGDNLCLAAQSYICSQSQREHALISMHHRWNTKQLAGTRISRDLLTRCYCSRLKKEKVRWLYQAPLSTLKWCERITELNANPSSSLVADFATHQLADACVNTWYESLCMTAQGTVSPLLRTLGALCYAANPQFKLWIL